jgi:hypothetical protein
MNMRFWFKSRQINLSLVECTDSNYKILDIEITTNESLCDYVKEIAKRYNADLAYCKQDNCALSIGLKVEFSNLALGSSLNINKPFLCCVYNSIGMPKKLSMETFD